ncbi:MAG: PQQ-binding-like beta-propeller repeat protein [Halioglobus sp.]
MANNCTPEVAATIDLNPDINGWGIDNKNHRFISESDAGISPTTLNQLRVKWVFALPDTDTPHTQPFITPDTVFIGDEPGMVYALDRETGCEKWRFDADTTVRTALRYVPFEHHGKAENILTFGTAGGEVFGIDPRTGKQQWRIRADEHPKTMVTGSSIDHQGVIFQPVSSWEAAWAVNPFYSCCSFRSSVIALNPIDGSILWRSYMIKEEPRLVKENLLWPDHYGPSGAPVWSQPTLDVKRNRLYVGTGENYSSPSTDTSDAIVALDLTTGEMLWHQQFLASDAWNVACESPLDSNCPDERGVDLDFGAPPILVTVNGRDFILAGQKNGAVYALDPDQKGKLLWQQKPGTGGKLGGIHFSMGVDEKRGVVYVPISDRPVEMLGKNPAGKPNPSLHAYDIASGKNLWSTPAPNSCFDDDGKSIENCHQGLSAAITITENLVFAPALDGYIRVFDAHKGNQLWEFDARGSFDAVNAKKASGGAIDLGGVYMNKGQLFVQAGYGTLGQIAGNAFIVLEASPTQEETSLQR